MGHFQTQDSSFIQVMGYLLRHGCLGCRIVLRLIQRLLNHWGSQKCVFAVGLSPYLLYELRVMFILFQIWSKLINVFHCFLGRTHIQRLVD